MKALSPCCPLRGDGPPLPKVKLEGERQRYTVQARNERFVIMTKPFNAKRTYLYTIADLERGVRGPCDLIFGLPCDVDTPEGAAEALRAIEAGEMEVSFRRCVDLSPADAFAIAVANPSPAVPLRAGLNDTSPTPETHHER